MLATKQKVSHVITKHARGLKPDQIARALEDMKKLKTHPREESANRFLLRRAERVFQELSLDARTVLGNLIDGFEGAIEFQDAAAIELHREALKSFLDRFDPSSMDDSSEWSGDDADSN